MKGWATERAADMLSLAGLSCWYLAVGGDLQAHGPLPGGGSWRFGIADPWHENAVAAVAAVAAVVELVDGAMATSGTAARGLHLWDGRNGREANALASMTVIGPQLRWADAFATAAFVMGIDGLEWVARHPGYHAIAVTHDEQLVSTDGAPLVA